LVDLSLPQLVRAWIDLPSWRQSRDFLESNPELLSEDAEVLLREIAMGGDVASKHLESWLDLFAHARQHGARAAFEDRIAFEDLRIWIASEDPKRHFKAHPELLRDSVVNALNQWLVDDTQSPATAVTHRGFGGIMALSRRGERKLAFDVFDAPQEAEPHLIHALEKGDAHRLWAIASIVGISDRADSSLKLKGLTFVAVAEALQGDTATAECCVDYLRELAAEEEKSHVHSVFVNAIATQPEHAGTFGRLLTRFHKKAAEAAQI
jgi:hypothetical protein